MKNLLFAIVMGTILSGCVVAAEPVYVPTYENVWVEAHWEYVNGINVWYPGRYVYRRVVVPRRVNVAPRRGYVAPRRR